jgi:hypothetical protein
MTVMHHAVIASVSEAIQGSATTSDRGGSLDCFALLAMTERVSAAAPFHDDPGNGTREGGAPC